MNGLSGFLFSKLFAGIFADLFCIESSDSAGNVMSVQSAYRSDAPYLRGLLG